MSWQDLTDGQRQAWDDWAAAHPVQDSLGQTHILTGQQSYVGTNALLLSAGPGAVTVPPLDPGPTAPVAGALTITAPDVASWVATPTPITSDYVMTVECSPPVSSGKNFNGDYRYIRSWSTSAASPFTFGAQLAAKYGPLPVGAKIFARLRIVRRDGFPSVYSEVKSVIVA